MRLEKANLASMAFLSVLKDGKVKILHFSAAWITY